MIFRDVMTEKLSQISYGSVMAISTILGILHTMIQIVQYQDLEDTNLCFRYETTGPIKTMDAIDVLPK